MLEYLKGFVDKTDPTKSLKHAAFAFAVVCSAGWLTYEIHRSGMSTGFVAVYTIFASAVLIAKVKNDPIDSKTPEP